MKVILTVSVAFLLLALSQLSLASEELAQKSNCVACHMVDTGVVGPSYKDIAAKYESDPATVQMLVDKVRNGGSGTWGDIPKPPNPAVSEEDAKTLVEWVLSLKN